MKKRNIIIIFSILLILLPQSVLADYSYKGEETKVLYIIGMFLLVIRIVVPILLIVISSIDLFEALIKSQDKDVKKIIVNILPKVISAIIIFLLPSLLLLILKITGKQELMSDYSCLLSPKSCSSSIWTDPPNIDNSTNNGSSVTVIDDESSSNSRNEDKMVYDPIKPNSSEKIYKEEETDTLKVYISKEDNYYLTRIWASDPYHQLRKEDSPKYGVSRYKASDLLKNAINNNNLKDKLLVGFNASGFYSLENNFDGASVKYYPGYDNTSVGTLVITNGKVIRNQYEKGDIVTWFITGITKDNKMTIFEDKKISETTVNDKKVWSEQVISSGILNTYTFAAPVILNGAKTSYSNKNSRMPGDNNEKKGLQLICQINYNNFVLFTSSSETRNKAIDVLLKLGCKTAVNLDGGSSVALLFKNSSSNNIDVILGNKRLLTEVGYFSE